VIRRLRGRSSNIPVILLTARDTISDRVHGLDLGADDYLIKPFATPELVARIKALIRRSNPQVEQLRVGGLCLDLRGKRATIHDLHVDFSVREWSLLEYLMQHTTRVVSKQQILDAIVPWGEEVTPNAIEVYVSRIRLKIARACRHSHHTRLRLHAGSGMRLQSGGKASGAGNTEIPCCAAACCCAANAR